MPRINARGLDMYYETTGDGPPVVCISGLSQDHLGWMFQAPAIAEAGYRCIAFDNRDAGQTAQSPSAYGIREMADDTFGLMDALGLSSAHVVGLSMGGMIAQEMAIGHPERILSLSLICTFDRIDPETAGILRAWRAARPHCDEVDFVEMLSAWLFTHRFYRNVEAVRGFLDLVRANPFPQSIAGFQRQCDAVLGHDAADRVSRITAPTQVIVGTEDKLTPVRLSRTLADRIAGARCVEVPDAAHVLSMETPDALNRVLIEFLEAQEAV